MVGLGFMAWMLWQLLGDPGMLNLHFAFWGVAGAVIIGVLGNFVVGLAFSDLVVKAAPSVGFGRSICAYYYSQIAKYIPGRIAALLIQRSMLGGPNASVTTVISNLELMLISCWLCTSAAIIMLVYTSTAIGATIIAAISVLTGTWLIRANWHPCVRRLTQFIPGCRSLTKTSIAPDKIPLLRAFCQSAGILILPTLSSYVLLTQGMNIDPSIAVPLTASLMFAWVFGVLAIIFPAGIGIRELAFLGIGSVLAASPNAELMAGVAIAARLLHVAVDIVGVALFVGIQRTYLRIGI